MSLDECKPMDSFPRHLTAAEINDPYMVVNSFFDTYAFPHAKACLACWLQAAARHGYWHKEPPGRLLYFYWKFEALLEALWLLSQSRAEFGEVILQPGASDENAELLQPEYFKGVHARYSLWDYMPRFLTKKEFINPYRAIYGAFKWQHLPEWRSMLSELLYTALIPESITEYNECLDLLKVQKHLHKLLEAAHLVVVRKDGP